MALSGDLFTNISGNKIIDTLALKRIYFLKWQKNITEIPDAHYFCYLKTHTTQIHTG